MTPNETQKLWLSALLLGSILLLAALASGEIRRLPEGGCRFGLHDLHGTCRISLEWNSERGLRGRVYDSTGDLWGSWPR